MQRSVHPYFCRQLFHSAVVVILISSPGALKAEAINVHGWDAVGRIFPEIVQQLQGTFDAEVVFTDIPMENYNAAVEERLIYATDVDVVGLMAASTARFSESGWIEPLAGDERMVSAANQHYKHLRDAIHYKGALVGLGLGAVVCNMPVVDMDAYQSLGLKRSDFPADWDDFYDQVVYAASKHRTFYLPHWHNGDLGLPMSFISEVLNRGGRIVELSSEKSAMLNDSGAAFDTLIDWRRAWDSGAIPEHVLDLSFDQYYQEFFAERYAVNGMCSHVLLSTKQYAHSAQRRLSPLPRVGQSWGSSTVGIFSIGASHDRSNLRATKDFLFNYSLGQGQGKFAVSRFNLEKNGFLPVYPELTTSPDIRGIIGSKLSRADDAEVLIDLYEHAPFPADIYNVLWFEEFARRLSAELVSYLRTPWQNPEHVISRINNHIREVRESYGY